MKRLPSYVMMVSLVSAGSVLFMIQHLWAVTRTTMTTTATTALANPCIELVQPKRSLEPSISADPLALSYGDLPGYTGWARPVTSSAAWYTISPSHQVGVVGIPVVWTLTCTACQNLEPLFDTRAYGPSIVPGIVQRHENGTHSVSMFFHDPGTYVVEIVLAFSHVAPLADFPSNTEPLYEGYLLPHAPFTLQVKNSNESSMAHRVPKSIGRSEAWQSRPTCGSQELFESTPNSPLPKARWKIAARTRGIGAVPDPSANTSYDEYKNGLGSIGFAADYVYRDCDLPSIASLVKTSANLAYRSKHTIVFIGDSHTRKQYNLFLEHFSSFFDSVYMKTNDGLLARFPEITHALDGLKAHRQSSGGEQIHILFNAGLHEIAILCSQRRTNTRGRFVPRLADDFSCLEQYESNIQKLTALVQSVPSKSLVFQSTSAGWLKWGNYGFGWEPNRTQEYPLDAHACHDFNRVALKVMRQRGVPIMDSFWLTIARPDHRQIDPFNSRGKKLVHAGVEVYEVLVRKWMTIVVESIQHNPIESDR